MKTLSLIAAISLTGCAKTTFYGNDGRPVAVFQGNMAEMNFERAADGSIRWSGEIDHASATKAQGDAAKAKIRAAGAGLIGLGAGALLTP